MTNTNHRYVAERPGWRTCAVCGQGANAGIHKRPAAEVIEQLTREAVHGPHGAKECPDESICPTHRDSLTCFSVFGTFAPPRYEP